MKSLISIITPCYNSEKYIGETINSVLAQTYNNWEWIIVDDNSNDNSVKIIESYKDSRIKLIKNSKNLGAADARNKAIEKANGRYLTFLDSDDLWLPEFLKTTLNFLITEKEELVYTSYSRVNENLLPLLDDFIAEDNIDFKRILYNCPIPMLTSVYDTSRIGKIKVPNVDLREDYAMWLNILKNIPRARAIKQTLAIYRVRKNSYSRNKLKIAQKQFLVYYNFLQLPLHKSIYYTLNWAFNGLKKYGKL